MLFSVLTTAATGILGEDCLKQVFSFSDKQFHKIHFGFVPRPWALFCHSSCSWACNAGSVVNRAHCQSRWHFYSHWLVFCCSFQSSHALYALFMFPVRCFPADYFCNRWTEPLSYKKYKYIENMDGCVWFHQLQLCLHKFTHPLQKL